MALCNYSWTIFDENCVKNEQMIPDVQEIKKFGFLCSKSAHFMWSEISVIEIHIILAFESLDMMLRAIMTF